MSTTDLNPNDYTGINGVIVGRAAGPADYPRYDKDKSGGFKEVRIAVDQGYKNKQTDQWVSQGTLWFSVIEKEDDPTINSIGKGDVVRVDDARISGREFERQGGGGKDWAFEARFGDITIVRASQDSDF